MTGALFVLLNRQCVFVEEIGPVEVVEIETYAKCFFLKLVHQALHDYHNAEYTVELRSADDPKLTTVETIEATGEMTVTYHEHCYADQIYVIFCHSNNM